MVERLKGETDLAQAALEEKVKMLKDEAWLKIENDRQEVEKQSMQAKIPRRSYAESSSIQEAVKGSQNPGQYALLRASKQ